MSCETLLIVTGPTASGKTALAVELAEALNGEVINADSVQVYRGFSIGAGAPSNEEFSRVPHHLFGVVPPNGEWNAGLFSAQAGKLVEEIVQRGRVPVIAGGTGLYLSALLGGLVDAEVSEEAKSRVAELEVSFSLRGLSASERTAEFHKLLSEVDPESGLAILKTDTLRIKRALLVALSSGTSLAELRKEHKHNFRSYSALVCCLLPPRAELYSRIDLRVEKMIEEGLMEEVKKLRTEYPSDSKPLQSIGYKQACRHLDGELTFEEFRESTKQETRRFAKRQETWWRHQPSKLGWRAGAEKLAPNVSTLAPLFRAFQLDSRTSPDILFYAVTGSGH